MTPFQKESRELFNSKVEELETRDWNKNWPSADKEAPTKCCCGKKLEKPKYKYKLLMPKSKAFPNGLVSSYDGQWRIDCSCGVCYIWSNPNVWKRTHRFSELHMFVNDNKTLLIPYDTHT